MGRSGRMRLRAQDKRKSEGEALLLRTMLGKGEDEVESVAEPVIVLGLRVLEGLALSGLHAGELATRKDVHEY